LTSSKIRPVERITKTSHQPYRYGSSQKKNLNLLLLECKGVSDRVVPQPGGGLHDQSQALATNPLTIQADKDSAALDSTGTRHLPPQIHQSELAYQTQMRFTTYTGGGFSGS